MDTNNAVTALQDSEKLIAVIGLGATGSPIADMLYRQYGDRFVLLSDSKHADRLRSGRLHINGKPFNPAVITPETYAGEKIGVLFICVKNYSIPETTEQIRGHLGLSVEEQQLHCNNYNRAQGKCWKNGHRLYLDCGGGYTNLHMIK